MGKDFLDTQQVTVSPKSLDPIYTVAYNMKWV